MKIRQDVHGLYVSTGGYFFRADQSRYTAGDEVKVQHLGGKTSAKVGEEVWYSHGTNFYLEYDVDGKYKSTRFRKSVDVFDPSYATTKPPTGRWGRRRK
jgi:hypothetical protein